MGDCRRLGGILLDILERLCYRVYKRLNRVRILLNEVRARKISGIKNASNGWNLPRSGAEDHLPEPLCFRFLRARRPAQISVDSTRLQRSQHRGARAQRDQRNVLVWLHAIPRQHVSSESVHAAADCADAYLQAAQRLNSLRDGIRAADAELCDYRIRQNQIHAVLVDYSSDRGQVTAFGSGEYGEAGHCSELSLTAQDYGELLYAGHTVGRNFQPLLAKKSLGLGYIVRCIERRVAGAALGDDYFRHLRPRLRTSCRDCRSGKDRKDKADDGKSH